MYTLTADDILLIMKHNFNWDQDELKYLKNNIKQILINKKSECFYCKSPLDEGSSPGDIEHIVPKDSYKFFSFLPINLTLTCRRCNTAKGRHNVLQENLNKSFSIPEDYPSTSGDFIIVHAHYDLYEKYIELQESIFFIGIDSGGKGKNTIKICNLTRLDLALSKVKLNKLQRKNDENLVKTLANLNSNSPEIKELLHQLEYKLNSYDWQREIAFEKVNKNLSVVDIVDELFKIDELSKITNTQITKLRDWLDYKDALTKYIDLIKYLNTLRTLVPLLIFDLEKLTYPTNSKHLLLDLQGIIKLKNLLHNRPFQGLQTRSKSKLLSLIADVEKTNFDDIPSAIFIENEIESMLECLIVIKEIFKNHKIKNVLPGINSQTFEELRNDITKLHEDVDKNPKLEILSNLEWYFQSIFTFEREHIWDIYKNLKELNILLQFGK
ncbi:hypothetical protein SAMN05428987_5266 [Paenibacillus sp. CF095]|uniref:HNH endonuclease n=1 Tax=Paenibacillus sp. CF095 TaxID=1881033 RepID=UPI00088283D0|nr:HNH endonuclease [Paenibacillus sp. CF095]SDD55333.1 hypothetical protein SAMN05428987_5266 [Paenibacillus sp. CF095]